MNLKIGALSSGKPFELPPDLALQKLAVLGISGSGKTCTTSVIAEEMCKAGLPWIALDPVSVWWGLRATREGKPSGYPVVVFGGDHADLPLEKGSGAKIAEALVSENVFAVIDLSLESKRFWHQFVTDFALELMQLNPETQRHIFIEEAPEFVPQRTKVDLTARCKEAVERLVRLGRNRGYGYTLISQRPATVDKDVLSQCENLLVLRTNGAHDRKALAEWLQGKAVDAKLDAFLEDLPRLESGVGYFWSPQWQRSFQKVRVRERETFHPGETRKVGRSPKAVALCDVRSFVEKLKPQLTKVVATVPGPVASVKPPLVGMDDVITELWMERQPRSANSIEPARPSEIDRLKQENKDLLERLRKAEQNAQEAVRRLEAVRKALLPQFEALRGVFEELGQSNATSADKTVYDPWLQKAGNGKRRRMLEVVIERRELTRAQLSTLSGTSINSSGFKNSLSWMRVNKLVNVEGEKVALMSV